MHSTLQKRGGVGESECTIIIPHNKIKFVKQGPKASLKFKRLEIRVTNGNRIKLEIKG